MKKIIYIFTIILIWQCAALVINRIIFPDFFSLLRALPLCYKPLSLHTAYSLFRILTAVAFSLLLGFPAGLILGYSKKLSRIFSPFIYLAGPIPKIALLPLIMLFFGIGETSKIFILVIVMIFQVIVYIRDCVAAIPEEYFLPFYTIKAPKKWIVRDILIPAAFPGLFTALRVGLSTGVSVLFFAETFGTRYGLGYFIMDSWLRVNYPQMYIGILSLGAMGFVLVFLLDMLEKKVCRWKFD